ncbi:ArsO family NAD(P)H-dependent flavin-containing monooxygenase [Nonomuraea sp. NPDC050227]|uniref:ArsO family NAD(P)H-dependent flavin-containing monooxygenase n=1 Tax=Nonomuraea sp. NPDC050227 TaxID=3364360 RepID=UPI00379AE80D
MTGTPHLADVVVIGAGQAGLGVGYHLRRAGADFVILDAQEAPGGAWRHVWPSLRLFTLARHSSLPGRMMPTPPGDGYPDAPHVVSYFTDYERRYRLPIVRPAAVRAVRRADDRLAVESAAGLWHARIVVSATGTWWRPYVPYYPGIRDFRGEQLHTAGYRGPEPFRGRRMLVVGGGNSAAQILADLSRVTEVAWATSRPPRLMPDELDGRAVFALTARRHRAVLAGRDPGDIPDLGDIIAVPPVREARDRGVLKAEPMFTRITPDGVTWSDGSAAAFDAIVWGTGFRPALHHLAPLRLRGPGGVIATAGTRVLAEPRLHLHGYGDWTGPASDTLIGAGHNARHLAAEIVTQLRSGPPRRRPA